jgi:hypothetical protein
MKKQIARARSSKTKLPIKFGDLAHLAPQMSLSLEDLSLPQDVLDDFEQAIDKLERMLATAETRDEHSEG